MALKEFVRHPVDIRSCCHIPSPWSGPGSVLRAVACIMALVETKEGRRMSSPLIEQGAVPLLRFTVWWQRRHTRAGLSECTHVQGGQELH